MYSASQVSSCGLRVAPPRTRIVAGATVVARSGGRTGLVIGKSLHSEAAPIPGNKKPQSRAGQGSFQNSRPFSASLTWPQAGRLKSTTIDILTATAPGGQVPVAALLECRLSDPEAVRPVYA